MEIHSEKLLDLHLTLLTCFILPLHSLCHMFPYAFILCFA